MDITTLQGAQRSQVLARYKFETSRRATFRTWPMSFNRLRIRPAELAGAGFVYFNQDDKVQCAFCLGIIGNWEPTDTPMGEHRQHFPHCPFVLGLPVGNVPVNPTLNYTPQPSPLTPFRPPSHIQGPQSADRAPSKRIYETLLLTCSHIFFFVGCKNLQLRDGFSPADVQFMHYTQPANLGMRLVDARMNTFEKWPVGLVQKPADLAAAGLYYKGV